MSVERSYVLNKDPGSSDWRFQVRPLMYLCNQGLRKYFHIPGGCTRITLTFTKAQPKHGQAFRITEPTQTYGPVESIRLDGREVPYMVHSVRSLLRRILDAGYNYVSVYPDA